MAALDERTVEAVEVHRALEAERLDALQRAVWPDAMGGDPQAVKAVLRIVDLRVRLLGLQVRDDPQPAQTWLVDPAYREGLAREEAAAAPRERVEAESRES